MCAAFAALLGPAAAQAAVTCTYDSVADRVTIELSTQGDSTAVRRSGTAINYAGSGGTLTPCGSATVSNTDTIRVRATGGGEQSVDIDLGGGMFAPGKTAEPSGSSEIELRIELGGGSDTVTIRGRTVGETIRLGTSGVSLNADGDADLTLPTGVDFWNVYPGEGADNVSAGGGLGTGNPLPTGISISGGPGNDVIRGGLAGDYLSGDDGEDNVAGGDGTDTVNGGPDADTLNGGEGNDGLQGGDGNDVESGGTGRDSFYEDSAANGADSLSGGPGVDSVGYYGRAVGVRVDPDGADDGAPGENDNVHADIENIDGGTGDDVITGTSANNTITGSMGADTLTGLEGDDFLSGGFGAGDTDELRGGLGDDFLDGGDSADLLFGEEGSDTMAGGNGPDDERGGKGDDSFSTASSPNGADHLRGGPGFDTVGYSSRTTGVSVTLNDTSGDGESGEGDNVHRDIENVFGGGGNDQLSGLTVSEKLQLWGLGGADELIGGGGSDFLSGGPGNDHLYGGDGDDDGTDNLQGLDDNDTFHSNDGGRDYIDGGNGTDDCADIDAFDTFTFGQSYPISCP